MKKIILLAFTVLVMAGCEKNATKKVQLIDGYTTVEIDSCEYVHGFYRLAHKGNCCFCKKRRQKELEELVIKLKEK